MKEPDVIIPEQAEFFLAFMFGKQNAHLPPYIPARQWRAFCVRLSQHLHRYVRANVVSDKEHHERIEVALSKLHDAAGASQGREAGIIAALAELCLLLLGAMPDHWSKGARRGSAAAPTSSSMNSGPFITARVQPRKLR